MRGAQAAELLLLLLLLVAGLEEQAAKASLRLPRRA